MRPRSAHTRSKCRVSASGGRSPSVDARAPLSTAQPRQVHVEPTPAWLLQPLAGTVRGFQSQPFPSESPSSSPVAASEVVVHDAGGRKVEGEVHEAVASEHHAHQERVLELKRTAHAEINAVNAAWCVELEAQKREWCSEARCCDRQRIEGVRPHTDVAQQCDATDEQLPKSAAMPQESLWQEECVELQHRLQACESRVCRADDSIEAAGRREKSLKSQLADALEETERQRASAADLRLTVMALTERCRRHEEALAWRRCWQPIGARLSKPGVPHAGSRAGGASGRPVHIPSVVPEHPAETATDAFPDPQVSEIDPHVLSCSMETWQDDLFEWRPEHRGPLSQELGEINAFRLLRQPGSSWDSMLDESCLMELSGLI